MNNNDQGTADELVRFFASPFTTTMDFRPWLGALIIVVCVSILWTRVLKQIVEA